MKPEVIVSDAELPAEVLRAIEKGRKIEAIKILRERTGIGLANAKVLVERAARQFAEKNPQPVLTDSGTGIPRLLMSLLVAVLIFAVYRHLTAS
jgi:hypothetical protein